MGFNGDLTNRNGDLDDLMNWFNAERKPRGDFVEILWIWPTKLWDLFDKDVSRMGLFDDLGRWACTRYLRHLGGEHDFSFPMFHQQIPHSESFG